MFDVETTHLKADFGTLLCVGYQWFGKPRVYVPAITEWPQFDKDPTNDRPLVKHFYGVLEQADMIVGFFSKGFDIKFLQAKSMQYGFGPLPNVPHVDLFYAAKGKFALSRKSLDNVSRYLGLEAKKTPVEGGIWKRAMTGHRPSINYIKKHCRADIELTTELYEKLRPLIMTHPRVKGYGYCRTCGSERIQRRGQAITTTMKPKFRFVCRDCGHWFTE